MIERTIEWSIRNRFAVIALVVLMAVGGVFALRRTPIDGNRPIAPSGAAA